MNRLLLVCLAAVVASSDVSAQARSTGPGGLRGAWSLIEHATTGSDAAIDRDPQPGLYIFTERHYSFTRVTGAEPRYEVENLLTARADDLRNLLRFAAQSGTYELSGNELRLRRTAALDVGSMAPGNSAVYAVRLQGDTVWLTTKQHNGNPIKNPATFKLRRVE
ncbi:MAG TPA: hypothetical protein VK864_08285 [Longimicrobiales bacterium]|nr:hypothetical protein [Longimicrobiales bacterium]